MFKLDVGSWLPDEIDDVGRPFRKRAFFRTSEAAYQYGKPEKQEVADWIAAASAPRLCAAAGHSLLVYDVRPDWSDVKVDAHAANSSHQV